MKINKTQLLSDQVRADILPSSVSDAAFEAAIGIPAEKYKYWNTTSKTTRVYKNGVWSDDNGGSLTSAAIAQVMIASMSQLVNSSTPTKITGTSAFMQQGTLFSNNGVDNLTIKYVGTSAINNLIHWRVIANENPLGSGADGTLFGLLYVNGVEVDRMSLSTDASHGGSLTGVALHSCNPNNIIELYTYRATGGGNGTIIFASILVEAL